MAQGWSVLLTDTALCIWPEIQENWSNELGQEVQESIARQRYRSRTGDSTLLEDVDGVSLSISQDKVRYAEEVDSEAYLPCVAVEKPAAFQKGCAVRDSNLHQNALIKTVNFVKKLCCKKPVSVPCA